MAINMDEVNKAFSKFTMPEVVEIKPFDPTAYNVQKIKKKYTLVMHRNDDFYNDGTHKVYERCIIDYSAKEMGYYDDDVNHIQEYTEKRLQPYTGTLLEYARLIKDSGYNVENRFWMAEYNSQLIICMYAKDMAINCIVIWHFVTDEYRAEYISDMVDAAKRTIKEE
jgi:hypothetical protein